MGNGENQSGQEIRPESSKEWLKFFKENSPEEELLVKTIRENKNQDPWSCRQKSLQAGIGIFDLQNEKSGKSKKSDQADDGMMIQRLWESLATAIPLMLDTSRPSDFTRRPLNRQARN